MMVNKITNYAEGQRLSVSQNVTADDVGRDASGSPIVLDVQNLKSQLAQLNVRIQSAAAGTTVTVYVETSDDATFATGVFTDEVLSINETAAVTSAKAYATTGFAIKRRYLRVSYDHT
ncbi:MAG: hypothetical protein ONA90_07505, partial [candidate division KSB1 bacterium]|nr:hypothetical protein [candidate division KSB1 bacterium]